MHRRHRTGVMLDRNLARYRRERAGNNYYGLKEMKSNEEPTVGTGHINILLADGLILLLRPSVS